MIDEMGLDRPFRAYFLDDLLPRALPWAILERPGGAHTLPRQALLDAALAYAK